MNYHNDLTVSHDAKAIPYRPGVLRKDGERNFGFVNLKTNPALKAILKIATALNVPPEALFQKET